MPTPDNILYYGDNLDILRNHAYFPNECVDLIYLDPPFNSARSYNVLFKDESGRASEAQITAFEDTWHWGRTAEDTYHHLITEGTPRVCTVIGALRAMLGENQMMAYLVMMAARLVELHRALKSTGSLYLHCDPTASHYLKMVLDAIFGPENFNNEIIWKRTVSKSLATRKLPSNHDVIFFYQKSSLATWNPDAIYNAYDETALDAKTQKKYTQVDEQGRRYQLTSLLNPSPNRPNLTYEFLGVTKVWRWTKERMQQAYEDGWIVQTKPGAVPRFKRFLSEQKGKPLDDVWTDIFPLNSQAAERLGYPTQKPLSLLERIINLSSKPGDVVLDPFCGCGTAIAAAQKLGRRWLGIDITHLSIALQKYRLQDMFDLKPGDYRVIGEPEDLQGAKALARDSENDGRYQFQWWALSLVRAKPLGQAVSGGREGKKGSDKGVDGVITFIDDASGKPKEVLVQVKSGKVKSGDVRDLRGTMERRKSAIGVFITLEPPTKDMEAEAAAAGSYYSDAYEQRFPRVQILSIEQLLHKAAVLMPPYHITFKQAARVKDDVKTTLPLFD